MLLDITLTGGLIFVGVVVTMLVLLVVLLNWQKKTREDTQRKITDKALLELFRDHPGGVLGTSDIAERTGLTKTEASLRLSGLATAGALTGGMNIYGTKAYYELSAPLEEVEGLSLSDEPFITLEDLQAIFKAYDYRVSPQDLIMATNLPWAVIDREMKHFRSKNVVEVVLIDRKGDSNRQYILKEPYLTAGPETARELNLELREILYDEKYLV